MATSDDTEHVLIDWTTKVRFIEGRFFSDGRTEMLLEYDYPMMITAGKHTATLDCGTTFTVHIPNPISMCAEDRLRVCGRLLRGVHDGDI